MTYEYNPHTLGIYNLAWYSDNNSVTENSDDFNTKEEDAAKKNKDTGRELIDGFTSLQSVENSQNNLESGEII